MLAISTIGIGIGAATAVFAAVHPLLLRPLPYERPGDLVRLYATNPGQGLDKAGLAWGDFLDLRDQARSLDAFAAYRTSTATLTGRERPEVVQVALVSAGLVEVLGVSPYRGQAFTRVHEVPDESSVVLLSYEFWQQRLGGADEILRGSLRLDGEAHRVVGVMPPGFGFPRDDIQIWAPLALSKSAPDRLSHYLGTVGRLAPGVDLAAAREELENLSGRLEREHPATNQGWGLLVTPLRETLVSQIRPALTMLSVAVFLLMLIACVNVINLLLARAVDRRAETALRSALGSPRGRLLGEYLLESTMLCLLGGALGLLLGSLLIRLVLSGNRDLLPVLTEVGVDGYVLGFVVLLSLAAGLATGVIPAVQLTRANLRAALVEQAATSSDARRAVRLRRSLLTLETALAVLLLVGAGLMFRGFLNLQAVELGFETANVVNLELSLPATRYGTDSALLAFSSELRDRLERVRGVEAVGIGSVVPLASRGLNFLPFWTSGMPAERTDGRFIAFAAVSPGYFAALEVPLVEGRAFDNRDHAQGPPVALINRVAAESFWPGAEAVGGTIHLMPRGSQDVAYRVIGVVENYRQHGLDQPVQPAAFVPYAQVPHGNIYVLIATAGASNPVQAAQQIVHDLDADLPITRILPLTQVVEKAGSSTRLYTRLFLIFGALGLVLAASGIYGVVAHTTSKRFREYGIRMALGADGRRLLWTLLRENLVWALVGIAVGLCAAYWGGRFVATLVFGVNEHDPWVLLGVSATLVVVATLGTLFGAHKVFRLQPSQVLRDP